MTNSLFFRYVSGVNFTNNQEALYDYFGSCAIFWKASQPGALLDETAALVGSLAFFYFGTEEGGGAVKEITLYVEVDCLKQ